MINNIIHQISTYSNAKIVNLLYTMFTQTTLHKLLKYSHPLHLFFFFTTISSFTLILVIYIIPIIFHYIPTVQESVRKNRTIRFLLACLQAKNKPRPKIIDIRNGRQHLNP